VTDDFDPFLMRSVFSALGVETPVFTDAFGRTNLAISREAMEKLRDAARVSPGYEDLADSVQRMLDGGPTHLQHGKKFVPVTEGTAP
jgi:hypothetical protein